MKHFIFCFFTLFICTVVNAQVFWQRTYGGTGDDFGRTIVVMDDGYIVAGTSNSFGQSATEVYFIKLDWEGTFMWGQRFGSPGFIYWAVASAKTPEGDVVLAGYTNDTDGAGYDGLVLKISPEGSVLWSTHVGGPDWDFFNGVTVDDDGRIYAAGETTSAEQGTQGWIVGLSEGGEVLWELDIPCNDTAELVAIDHCGEGIVAFSGNCVESDSGMPEIMAGTIDPEGSILWQRIIEEAGTGYTTGGRCGRFDDVLIVGRAAFDSTSEQNTPFIIKSINLYDGESNWTRSWSPGFNSIYKSIHSKETGAVMVAGTFTGGGFSGWDATSIELDEFGFLVQGQSGTLFGGFGDDRAFDIQPTPDGGYIIAGESNSFGNGYQVHVAKVGPGHETTQENEDFLDIVTSTESTARNPYLQLAPNPANDQVRISWPIHLGQSGALRIYDHTGRQVDAVHIAMGGLVPTGHLSTGLYQLQLRVGSAQVTQKLLVAR